MTSFAVLAASILQLEDGLAKKSPSSYIIRGHLAESIRALAAFTVTERDSKRFTRSSKDASFTATKWPI